jgi:hypothetical protein
MGDTLFTAYAEDCLVRGVLDLPDDARLTDFVNEAETIKLSGAQLRALDDGRVVDAGDIELERSDVFAWEAPPAPPMVHRRIRTRTTEIRVELGPYIAIGLLHAPAAGDPLLVWSRRKQMVPITNATVLFKFAGQYRKVLTEALIINRHLVRRVERTKYEKTKIDYIGISPVDPRAVDYTGTLSPGSSNSAS